jgi:predicted nucleic acid-binding protein
MHRRRTGALRIAQKYRISADDARFVATAEKLGAKLVTDVTKLRQAAPTLTLSLADVLANS